MADNVISKFYDDVNKLKNVRGKGATKDLTKEYNRQYRRLVSRLSSVANKRVDRLKKGGLKDSPALQRASEGGKFGVKGKTYNQLQKEVARLERFLSSETSTVKGVDKNLKRIADNTGIKYKSTKELRTKSKRFFEISSKVEQYLRNVHDAGSAVGYQQIWTSINTYETTNAGSLNGEDDEQLSTDEIVERIADSIMGKLTMPKKLSKNKWFKLK